MNKVIHTLKKIHQIKKSLFCALFASYPTYPQVYPPKTAEKKVA